jgi:DNA-binding LacI/PurR family transcriptional regulator
MNHVLVIANETVAGSHLIEVLEEQRPDLVTVICPVSQPQEGYVVYEDTRRASAGRRLDRTLSKLREDGIAAHGLVVDSNPVDAARDALNQLEPPPTAIVVSTHPREKSGWMRKHVVEKIQKVARDIPVEHVVVDLAAEDSGVANVLVVANETVVGEALLDQIRERARSSPASFLLVCPQNDPTEAPHPDAERRLRRTLSLLRADGIEAHGQIAHPDPHAAAMHAVRDERIDEIIVSTFPGERGSSWLRGDLVERLRKDTGLPVQHVVVEPEAVGSQPA